MNVSSEVEAPQPRTVPPALLALVAPDTGMERQARVGGARLAFLIAFACALLAAFAQVSRLDARSATLEKMEKAGQLQTMSEKQLEDETRNAERLAQVGKVATGALEAPVFLLLQGLGVVVLVWFLRGKVKGRAVFPVAAAVLLPTAVANLLDGITALRQASLPVGAVVLAPRNIAAIAASLGHALPMPWAKLGNAFDFFSLWGAVLMGYGVASAGEVPLKRAMIGTLCAWLCWRLLTNVAGG